MKRGSRIAVVEKHIPAAGDFHCKPGIGCCYSMIGYLGYFVKIDSVVLVTKDPVYLFLVSKTTDPDFTAVV